jgi:hypothetical protein
LVHVSREYLFLLPYTRNDDEERREQRTENREQWGRQNYETTKVLPAGDNP